MQKNIKGLIFTIFIAISATITNRYLFAFIETLTLGILFAIIWRNTVGIRTGYISGVSYAAKEVLKWGIILLGLRLNFVTLSQLGARVFVIVLTVVVFGQAAAYYLGKIFGLNKKLAVLLGIGSSICGTSAIVALGPVIDAGEEDTTMAAAIISIMGTFGVIIFSFLAFLLPLSDMAFGVWAGTTLQNVPHAIAGAFARGEAAGDAGTLVKMGRVALLAPTAIVYSSIFQQHAHDKKKKARVPSYVIGFLVVGIIASLNNYFHLFPWNFPMGSYEINLFQILRDLGNWFVLIAMVGMGLQADIRSFKAAGLKAFVSCSLLFVMICIFGLSLIILLNL
ncbi:conserved hypothetical integral membrane protein [Natronincola peptidivorans]|uniref:Conserved hypothetical integral membrane protein n=1 Tax=Natronincola peptidivorans TaxID=426128 RepID=A0A1I0DAM7_9FIRM|nr:putative sulfate exporter family transporter [Natronincola peptidivorans]SET28617.1 conserved hypothetical integral membrane protein [Natronincola peptidivorans]